MTTPTLNLDSLNTSFHTEEGVTVAVRDVSFNVMPGETLGLVGESGSGKSVTSLSIMRLLPERISRVTANGIQFLGQELSKFDEAKMRELRGQDLSMIFQEPGAALNPVMRVGDQVAEAILAHREVSKKEALERTVALFEEVGIPEPERRIRSYPHEMSGGQKQRVMIAMALSCDPKLLIADEPTTALDVTIQAQILDLLRRLRDERQMSTIFVTHDLGVIAEIADRVAVMFRGDLVEVASVREIFTKPGHPYTRGLLACRPRLETTWRRLPTVSDFMDKDGGEAGIFAGLDGVDLQDRLDKRFAKGSGRLLSPKSELSEEHIAAIEIPPELSLEARKGELPQEGALIPEDESPLLSVTGLKVHFPIRGGLFGRVKDLVRAVDGIDFRIYRGQTLGLVGESGCGKTTTGRALVRLQDATDGTITFDGIDVRALRGAELRNWRSRVQIVFQDPYSSLNPRMTVEAAITEALSIHGIGADKAERIDRAGALLEEVGLKKEHLRRYPHEFSGGQRQRIGIARALAVEPELIVCDESVSALDVSVQAQVLNLLKDLQDKRGLTYLFVSHDLSVVKFMADMMVVMKDGKIVEAGPSDAIYRAPREEYTKKLIAAIPDDSLENIDRRQRERVSPAV